MSILVIRTWFGDPLVLITIATLLGGIGQMFIKYGVSNVGDITGFNVTLLRALLSHGVLAGLSAYALSSLFYIMVVHKAGLSFAYPFVALNQVIVFLLAWLLFQEAIPPLRAIGLVVICVGVFLIALSK